MASDRGAVIVTETGCYYAGRKAYVVDLEAEMFGFRPGFSKTHREAYVFETKAAAQRAVGRIHDKVYAGSDVVAANEWLAVVTGLEGRGDGE
jgi:hypothetical protein